MQINLLELMSTLIPSIIAVVAIIVPAIQTLQLKKLELLEKQQEHLSAALTEAYVDFCSGFVRFQSGISDGAIQAAESAYKLAAMCDEDGAWRLMNFAACISNLPVGFDPAEQYTMFTECVSIILENLKRQHK